MKDIIGIVLLALLVIGLIVFALMHQAQLDPVCESICHPQKVYKAIGEDKCVCYHPVQKK